MSVKFSATYDSMTLKNNHLLDPDAIVERRVVLTKKQERARRAETQRWAQRTENNSRDYIYALVATAPGREKIYFYVGLTGNYSSRWAQHRTAIFNGRDQKRAYVMAREYIREGYTVALEELGDAAERTEAEWVAEFLEAGAPLENDAPAVGGKRKKKKLKPNQREIV